MKLDPLLERELMRRLEKDNRLLLFVTRVKMLIHVEGADWQENCSGLLVLFQRKYSYGLIIFSAANLDVNFDFELYSNFPNYTKYIGDLKALIFLAPSQKNCLKVMLVLESKAELSELKKQIDKIYNIASKSNETDYLDRPEVQEILKKVPIDENLLVKDLLFKQNVEKQVKDYFAKTTGRKDEKKNSGFKFYALGREEWKIDLEETNYLRAKFEAEILEELAHLQKQARVRTPNK